MWTLTSNTLNTAVVQVVNLKNKLMTEIVP